MKAIGVKVSEWLWAWKIRVKSRKTAFGSGSRQKSDNVRFSNRVRQDSVFLETVEEPQALVKQIVASNLAAAGEREDQPTFVDADGRSM